jgi:hypothetical protein
MSRWGATLSIDIYSDKRVYVLGLDFASEHAAMCAAQALRDAIMAIAKTIDVGENWEQEREASKAIDVLLGEEPDTYSYGPHDEWTIDVAELTESGSHQNIRCLFY